MDYGEEEVEDTATAAKQSEVTAAAEQSEAGAATEQAEAPVAAAKAAKPPAAVKVPAAVTRFDRAAVLRRRAQRPYLRLSFVGERVNEWPSDMQLDQIEGLRPALHAESCRLQQAKAEYRAIPAADAAAREESKAAESATGSDFAASVYRSLRLAVAEPGGCLAKQLTQLLMYEKGPVYTSGSAHSFCAVHGAGTHHSFDCDQLPDLGAEYHPAASDAPYNRLIASPAVVGRPQVRGIDMAGYTAAGQQAAAEEKAEKEKAAAEKKAAKKRAAAVKRAAAEEEAAAERRRREQHRPPPLHDKSRHNRDDHRHGQHPGGRSMQGGGMYGGDSYPKQGGRRYDDDSHHRHIFGGPYGHPPPMPYGYPQHAAAVAGMQHGHPPPVPFGHQQYPPAAPYQQPPYLEQRGESAAAAGAPAHGYQSRSARQAAAACQPSQQQQQQQEFAVAGAAARAEEREFAKGVGIELGLLQAENANLKRKCFGWQQRAENAEGQQKRLRMSSRLGPN